MRSTLDQPDLHYVGAIPQPPEAYIAHPYTLLSSGKVIGRQAQLDLLSEWVTATDHTVRVLNVVAIGGMGKSALTWKWFNEIAPSVMQPMAGRMWWSFYESDASFENFVIRALAYITCSAPEDIREITAPERERELLAALDREPYLIVLDGLERMLIAYARMDAARLDDDALDEQTANAVAGAVGLPAGAQQTMFSPHRLRKAADPRAGNFLRKLATVQASRILVSTRLYPADLQRVSGYPLPGSFAVFLSGLDEADALALWRAFGANGDPDELRRLFNLFDRYPLLIRALAGEVAHNAGGDFAAWRRAHRAFKPENQPPDAIRAHVMTFALQGLNPPTRKTLDTIAAFRMPTPYDSLQRLLVGGRGLFRDEVGLKQALSELEARGLIGRDARGNRYDLHPIVRGVAWNALDERARRGLYSALNAHFGAMPPARPDDVRSLDDLTGSIELYNTLIGLEQYDEAFALYVERLSQPMMRRLGAGLQRVELLEMLFPDGLDNLPRLGRPVIQARALNALALAYQHSGQPGRAVPAYLRAAKLAEAENHLRNVVIALCNMVEALRQVGELFTATSIVEQALLLSRAQGYPEGEVLALQLVGLVRAARGDFAMARIALERARRMAEAQNNPQSEGVCCALLAQVALWQGDRSDVASALAERALMLAEAAQHEADMIRAAWLRAELRHDASALAEVLTRARAAQLHEQELAALVALAELQRQAGDLRTARLALDDLWETAERGPYRLLHADAYNVLAQIERDAGNPVAAQQTATAAYYLAWCGGAPFAYHTGLEVARAHLRALNAPEPDDLPSFDSAQHEPLPRVDIDPDGV